MNNANAKQAYAEYLQSPRWRSLRSQKLRRNPFCECCGAKTTIEVHHLSYKRGWGNELLRDLMTLCYRCHRLIHDKLETGELVIKPKQGVRQILRASRDFLRITVNPDHWPKRRTYSKTRTANILRIYHDLRNELTSGRGL